MFLSWDGFIDRFMQIFRDLKILTIVKRKI